MCTAHLHKDSPFSNKKMSNVTLNASIVFPDIFDSKYYVSLTKSTTIFEIQRTRATRFQKKKCYAVNVEIPNESGHSRDFPFYTCTCTLQKFFFFVYTL